MSITGEWQSWQGKVPQIEVETHKVASPDVVVPTLDTVRHEALLYTWLAEHKPLVLCGPPGSGKTMTLFSALRALPDMEVSTSHILSNVATAIMAKDALHIAKIAIIKWETPALPGRGSELLQRYHPRAALEDL